MKDIYILKIGGSVATDKQGARRSVRKELLFQIAQQIRDAQKKGDFDLILIHGAGSFGHLLAHQYALTKGTGEEEKKIHGALLSRQANQRLNADLTKLFFSAGLKIVPVHTASVITHDKGCITSFDMKALVLAITKGYVPLLYGDMVFDETLGMSICSGDGIGAYLAEKLNATKMFFASDIKGVFDKDPHLFSDAKLIEKIALSNIHSAGNISHSHSIDATGGLGGKISSLAGLHGSTVRSIEIFNGLVPENYSKVLRGESFMHTTIIP